jgi:hypothetical protein
MEANPTIYPLLFVSGHSTLCQNLQPVWDVTALPYYIVWYHIRTSHIRWDLARLKYITKNTTCYSKIVCYTIIMYISLWLQTPSRTILGLGFGLQTPSETVFGAPGNVYVFKVKCVCVDIYIYMYTYIYIIMYIYIYPIVYYIHIYIPCF